MTPTTPTHQRPKEEPWYPCEWAPSLEDAVAYVEGRRRLCYVFFHLQGPLLQGNFYRDAGMQKLSRERLVFVDVPVLKTPAPEQRALLRRCKVTTVPCAAITDIHGNPLYFDASTTSADELFAQFLRARRAEKMLLDRLAAARDEAERLCGEARWLRAAGALAGVRRERLLGLPILEEIEKLFLTIDARLEERLAQILASRERTTLKKQQLRALKAQAHEDLPVRARIETALKEL